MLIGFGLWLILISVIGPAPFDGSWWLLLIGCSMAGAWLNDAKERIR